MEYVLVIVFSIVMILTCVSIGLAGPEQGYDETPRGAASEFAPFDVSILLPRTYQYTLISEGTIAILCSRCPQASSLRRWDNFYEWFVFQ